MNYSSKQDAPRGLNVQVSLGGRTDLPLRFQGIGSSEIEPVVGYNPFPGPQALFFREPPEDYECQCEQCRGVAEPEQDEENFCIDCGEDLSESGDCENCQYLPTSEFDTLEERELD